jgi:hypothetical protein
MKYFAVGSKPNAEKVTSQACTLAHDFEFTIPENQD